MEITISECSERDKRFSRSFVICNDVKKRKGTIMVVLQNPKFFNGEIELTNWNVVNYFLENETESGWISEVIIVNNLPWSIEWMGSNEELWKEELEQNYAKLSQIIEDKEIKLIVRAYGKYSSLYKDRATGINKTKVDNFVAKSNEQFDNLVKKNNLQEYSFGAKNHYPRTTPIIKFVRQQS